MPLFAPGVAEGLNQFYADDLARQQAMRSLAAQQQEQQFRNMQLDQMMRQQRDASAAAAAPQFGLIPPPQVAAQPAPQAPAPGQASVPMVQPQKQPQPGWNAIPTPSAQAQPQQPGQLEPPPSRQAQPQGQPSQLGSLIEQQSMLEDAYNRQSQAIAGYQNPNMSAEGLKAFKQSQMNALNQQYETQSKHLTNMRSLLESKAPRAETQSWGGFTWQYDPSGSMKGSRDSTGQWVKLGIAQKQVPAVVNIGGGGGAGGGSSDQNQVAMARAGMPRTQVVAGYGASSNAQWKKITSDAIDQIMQENPGITRGDAARQFAMEQQGYKATSGALMQNTKDLAAIRPYERMLNTNANIAIDLGKRVTLSDSRLANRSINWLKQNAGDNPDANEYLAQMTFVQTEAARVLNNPRLVGQLTDSARQEMEKVVSGDMPIKSTERVLKRIMQDGRNRVKAMEDEHDRLLHGDKATEEPAPSSEKMTAERWASMKSGDTFIDEHGNTRMKP